MARPGKAASGIERERPPGRRDGSVAKRTIGLAMAFPGLCKSSNRQLMCGEIAGSQSHVPRELGVVQLRDESRHDGLRQLFLDGENVLQHAIVTLGPDMAAGQGIDQLGRHANARSGTPDAPLEHVSHAQLARDLADVDILCPCRRNSNCARSQTGPGSETAR